MKLLSVGLTDPVGEVREKLEKNCLMLTQEGYKVAVDEINKGNYTFLGCNIIDGEMSFRTYEKVKKMVKKYVAKILTEQVVTCEEKKLIRKIIEHDYYYFSAEEQNIVYNNTLRTLNGQENGPVNFDFSTRCNNIFSLITDYFDTHHELILEGFINFRLKDYRSQLEEIIDKVVDDLMMEMEYREFIKVLRYFVEVQEPKMEEVHVIIRQGGSFKILDAGGNVVNSQYLDNFSTQSADEISYEDLLITALITIAPHNIVLHNPEAAGVQSVVETIKNVFDGRVLICRGCEICTSVVNGKLSPS